MALRFSPMVHGMGDHGFTATLTKIAKDHESGRLHRRRSTRWAAVYRWDAARMVRLPLEQAPAGSRMHAVAEGGLPSRDIAAALGD